MTCFLRIEMHYLEPCKTRLSAWIVEFNLSVVACMTYPWILGEGMHMDLGIVGSKILLDRLLRVMRICMAMSGD